jgi:hypothetical protein
MTQTATKPASRFSINPRLIAFAAVMLLVVGYPLYIYIESEITHGVKQRGDGYTEVDLKAMSLFEFDQTAGKLSDVPQRWRELNGKKIIVRGEIAPTAFSAREANQFDLVYSVAKCCFQGRPQVQHFVKSTVVNSDQAPYYQGLVEVSGTLHVNVENDGQQVTSVYQIDVDKVKPVL